MEKTMKALSKKLGGAIQYKKVISNISPNVDAYLFKVQGFDQKKSGWSDMDFYHFMKRITSAELNVVGNFTVAEIYNTIAYKEPRYGLIAYRSKKGAAIDWGKVGKKLSELDLIQYLA